MATFTDASGVYSPSDYQINVNWGDGSSATPGFATSAGSTFIVQSQHEYLDYGNYPVSVQITNTVTQASTTVTGEALVTDVALMPSAPGWIQTNADGSFSGPLGTVYDTNPASSPADLSGTIDWGDGSVPATATLSPNGQGQYTVSGSYQWAQAGTYTVTVTVTDAGGSQTSFTDTAQVGPMAPPSGTSIVPGAADGVVISQVYASGGQTSSAFAQDYIELLNTTTAAVPLSGWTLQYADVNSGSWQMIPLGGLLQPGQYYLVQAQATGSSGQANIPTPDQVSSLPLDPFGGKVALVNTTAPLSGPAPAGTNIIDLVGYGLADAYEGSGAAPVTDPTTADVRGSAGFAQTQDNSSDFSADTPTPSNMATPPANFPPVDAVPGSQWTPQDTPLVFSTANGNALSVSDFDAGSNSVEVSLLADSGTVTLATLSGLTLVQGTGSNDTEVTFDGTLSAVNTALDGLTFTPATGFTGAATLGISTDDLGDSGGTGGDQFDVQGVLVSVGGPVVAVATTASTDENSPVSVDVLASDSYVADSSQLTLSVVSGPADGQAIVTTDSSGYPTITYAPNSYFSGTDSFVYQVSDGQGHSSEATVTVTVNAVNFAVINPPADQVNDEGDSISLQLQTPNNDGSVPLTFAASGLPAGLSIDPSTGIISGIPLYTDAETNLGQYTVTVSATGPGTGDSDSEHFNWTINDGNRIVPIDDQVSEAGQPVNFQPVVQDNLGDTLTFNVTGLPPGLTFDPATGAITGTPTGGDPGVTTYAVTYQATGGGDTDTQTFNWSVVSGSGEYVFFSINGTLNTSDDVSVVGEQVPVTVTFFDPGVPGPQSVFLEQPSGLASLSISALQLADGQSAQITLTQQAPSVEANDVQLVAFNGPQFQQIIGQAALTATQKPVIESVAHIPGEIDAADTGKKEAIPPRVSTPYSIKFPGVKLPNDKVFTIAVLGQSATHGRTALISVVDQNPHVQLPLYAGQFNNFYQGNIKGIDQTTPPGADGKSNAGNLMMAVYPGWVPDPLKAKVNPLVLTKGFSVAAAPVKVSMANPKPIHGDDIAAEVLPKDQAAQKWAIGFGIKYTWTLTSNSGNPVDLNTVQTQEVVVPQSSSGMYAGAKTVTSPWQPPATTGVDYHATVFAYRKTQATYQEARANMVTIMQDRAVKSANAKPPIKNTKTEVQHIEFADNRIGIPTSAPVVIWYSGFQIVSTVLLGGDGYAIVQVQKKPARQTEDFEVGVMKPADTEPKPDPVK